MSDLSILFSGPMARAILREIEQPGTGKTQTRRILKPLPRRTIFFDPQTAERDQFQEPRYAAGAGLYVREAWRTWAEYDDITPRDLPNNSLIGFEAGQNATIMPPGRLRQGMHMPRWASRITLTVTDVRVQRLQEISEADAKAEGMWSYQTTECDGDPRLDGNAYRETCWHWRRDIEEGDGYSTAKSAFQHLWDSLNVDRGHGWDANPWVAAYTFRPILGNIDEVAR